ncbi:MAG: outer membrane beta-barrel protein, partial [Betaproteobacteria bacterium]
MAALAGLVLVGAIAPAAAQSAAGFYGGISLRDRAATPAGIAFGPSVFGVAEAPLAAAPLEETATRQRVFGGYRWRNDVAVEAAFARSESYALRPFGAGSPRGVGLTLAAPQDASARSAWNVDVVGSYTFLRAFALYGRVGYAQAELAPAMLSSPLAGDVRRTREGINYGLGMSYDVTRALGVNLEYTRFGRFAFESTGSTLPENDQLRLGVRFR